MASDLKAMYSTLVKDTYPDTLTIRLGDEELVYESFALENGTHGAVKKQQALSQLVQYLRVCSHGLFLSERAVCRGAGHAFCRVAACCFRCKTDNGGDGFGGYQHVTFRACQADAPLGVEELQKKLLIK